MMDQRAKFISRGLVAEFVGEEQTDKNASRKVLEGKVQLMKKIEVQKHAPL